MSDPLQMPRRAAAEMMMSAAETALGTLKETMLTAMQRAATDLASATDQDEIGRIRDRYVSSVVHLGNTPYVRR
jgi:hypothetical protein